jgi:putative phosphoesterase
MRIAALYDIHGNLPALEAVLHELGRADVDRIVVGGDVFPGPMPLACLDRLLNLDWPTQFILGNGDREVLAHLRGEELRTVPEPFREVVRWSAQQLGPEHAQLLADWPLVCHIDVAGLGAVLFCHGTPRSDTEIFTRLTPEERLVPLFEALDASVIVCGHTHMQFDRRIGRVRVVNAGSVGMPFGEPGAYWLLLGPNVEPRYTRYDLGSAVERIAATRYPQARDFAERYVLQPPSEADMLARYTRASI